MTWERDGDKMYAPTEPCHYGMILMPPESDPSCGMVLLPQRRRKFELLPLDALSGQMVDTVA